MTAREHGNVGRAFEMRADTIQNLFERCDVFRKPQRFLDMLKAAECDCFGRSGLNDIKFPQTAYLAGAMQAAMAVNAGAVAQNFLGQPTKIAAAIHAARCDAVAQFCQNYV